MAPMHGCHLAVFSVDVVHHFVATFPPPCTRSAAIVVFASPVNLKLSKMAGN